MVWEGARSIIGLHLATLATLGATATIVGLVAGARAAPARVDTHIHDVTVRRDCVEN